MARGDEPLTGLNQRAKVAAGAVVLALLVAVVLGAASALVWAGAGDLSGLVPDAYLARIAAFTLLQATLSTLLSLALGVLLARSLARQTAFVGRGLLVRLLALPLALPAIVAVLGVVAVWGGRGWVNGALTALDMGRLPSIYGLGGILLAHVFFNLPLAARLMLGHFERVPAEHWRLAAQLALPPATSFRLIEWPVVRRNVPGVAGLVFMLCLTSFAVVLTLGGGPGATTLEVAIYQALRFDFDPTRAVVLAAAQLALTAGLLGLAALFGADLREEPGLGRPIARYDGTGTARALDFALITLAAAFVALPMLAVVVDGLGADLARLVREAAVQRALLTSLAIGASAAILGVAMAVALIAAARATTSLSLKRACAAASSLTLVVPPVLLGAGWFVLLRPVADVFALAPVMIVTVNAMMALPFAVRVLGPAIDSAGNRTDRLAAHLGIGGIAWVRLIGWPLLRRPLMTAFAFAMALSLGDLGAIALLGSDRVTTLPYLLLQRMGSYRTADAAGIALILGALTLAVFAFSDTRRARFA